MNHFKPISASSFRALAFVAVLGVLGSAQVLADEPKSIKVSYADLDLNTQAGALTLYNRIRGAARTVCGFDSGTTLVEHSAWKRCFNGAVDKAVTTVNSPQLTALHQGKSPAVTAMAGK